MLTPLQLQAQGGSPLERQRQAKEVDESRRELLVSLAKLFPFLMGCIKNDYALPDALGTGECSQMVAARNNFC